MIAISINLFNKRLGVIKTPISEFTKAALVSKGVSLKHFIISNSNDPNACSHEESHLALWAMHYAVLADFDKFLEEGKRFYFSNCEVKIAKYSRDMFEKRL